jgi:hypothetical protein
MDSIRLWMTEFARTEETPGNKPLIEKRVGAINDLFSNWRNMTGDQFAEVMTTSNFSNYMTDALSRMFYDQYEYQRSSWRDYTYPDTTPDFRDVHRFRLSEPGTLLRRREKGQGRATSVSSSGPILYGVDQFDREFDISWETILNDDLGALRQVPERMRLAASLFEDEFVSNLYDNATTQAALVALGSLYSGTGRLTEPNLAAAITAFMTRTGTNGKKLNIQGLWLVIPPELTIQAAKILESAQTAGNADNDKNVIPRWIKGVRVDSNISTAAPNIPWYLIAQPTAAMPTITVARLQGVPGPAVLKKKSDIETVTGSLPAPLMMASFDTGDIVYAVLDIIGGWDDPTYVGVTDYQGIYYSSGTTP